MKFLKYILFIVLLTSITCVAQNNATHSFSTSKAVSSEKYQSMTFNGIWSWFSDPRAVYFEGKHKRTYAGWVDNYGDVHIGFYDHETKEIQSHVIYDNLEIDDHNNPSILFDASGRLQVFFNTHSQEERPLYMRTSTNPEDISEWNTLKELDLNNNETGRKGQTDSHTYTNPIRLSKEDGKLYIFWRGVGMKPSYSVSTDNGKTWSSGEILFLPNELQKLKIPYTKVYSDGISKIHFVFTDGHPSKETKIGLYYMYYENGSFYKANGKKIKDINQLPVLQSELDIIFESDTVKSWNWDIAQDENGNPIVTFAKFPDKETHIYSYATFSNNEWRSYDLLDAGGWFPETRKGTIEAAPHYSGGIVIDHENPNTVYISVKRKGIFEIEAWTTKNKGKSWKVKRITQNSAKNNVRPFAVRGATKGNPLQVLWLQNTNYIYYALNTREKTDALNFEDRYHTAVKMNVLKPTLKAELTKENLIHVLREVVEHQLENPKYDVAQTDWRYGVGFAGVEAFAEITKEARYLNELTNIKQYQKEEVEDEEEIDIKSIFWSYLAKSNRNYLQRLEEFTISDFEYYVIGLDCASMIRAIENFDEVIIKIEEFKEKFKKNLETAVIDLENYDASKLTLRGKAFLIYALAKSMRKDLLDKKYKDLVIQSWKRLHVELLEKDTISNLDIATSGAILLAGKEVFEILNGKF